ncbi:MAG: DUF1553 domain-containing protein [Akkermansiaceae bacterium]
MISRSLTVFLVLAGSSLAFATEEVSYNSDVRPILSDKCFLCHGPDVKMNKADLRLDTPEGAFAALAGDSSNHGIVPGSLEKSEVWKRINSTDPDEIMPTPKSKLPPLNDQEKSIIARWIEQGAKYEKHWAFVDLPAEIAIPKIETSSWARNPIDHFVAARLTDEGLNHSPEADPIRWFRRVSFALTGLPPTLEQLETFKNNLQKSPDTAHENAVDAFLDTRAYAENMATPWLDAVRYADTWGYHADSNFTAWPYRDYVIRAFEKDMPYNQFVTENIAGDLLPNATRDQRLATASNRFNRMTNEGGSNQLEFFLDGVADRVNTVGTAYLGLTMECSKCHDHKYDPITAKEYFQLSAFFNSINEDGLYIHGNISPPPSLLLPTEQQEKQLADHRKKSAELEAQLAQISESARTDFQTWKNSLTSATELTMADQSGFFDFNKDSKKPFESRVQPTELKKDKKGNPIPLAIKTSLKSFVPGPKGKGTALALNGDDKVTVENFFNKDRYNPFTVGLWIKDTQRAQRSVVVWHRAYGTEVGYHGIDLRIEDGFLSGRVFRAWPDNGLGIKTKTRLPRNEWHHLTWTYDGMSRIEGLKFYLNGEPIETEITNQKISKSVTTPTYSSGRHFTLGAIFRGPGFAGGQVDEVAVFDRAVSSLEARQLAKGDVDLAAASEEQLFDYYLGNFNEDYRKTVAEISEIQKSITDLETSFTEVPVMEDMKEARPAYILTRGEFNNPDLETGPVERDTFAFMLPFPKDAPRDRLGLAQWLTDPRHPLTTRVYINRIWQQIFGDGLVGTTENFGLQGDLPTHPQLLDWLCRNFIEQGWSTKKLVKQMVLSATYRQDSVTTPELLERDPFNDLLARGPAFRLPGEQIRDAALASAGLLRQFNGGPPVHPYGPTKKKGERSDQVHQRSVYSYWKRTVPQANMTIFDKPSLEVCSVERNRTNSPAQALVLLNDRHFVEAARKLAVDILQSFDNDERRIHTAWLRVASREPKEFELKTLQELLQEQRAYFKENPENAKKLLAIGVFEHPKDLDPHESAAMTTVCQTIFNTDAAIWSR